MASFFSYKESDDITFSYGYMKKLCISYIETKSTQKFATVLQCVISFNVHNQLPVDSCHLYVVANCYWRESKLQRKELDYIDFDFHWAHKNWVWT